MTNNRQFKLSHFRPSIYQKFKSVSSRRPTENNMTTIFLNVNIFFKKLLATNKQM